MNYTAAVITVNSGCPEGPGNTSYPEVEKMLSESGWEIVSRTAVPNDFEKLRGELVRCSYEMKVCLAVTVGGTGFSRRDVTPEATEAVIDRRAPGIPEAIRAAIMKTDPRGMLSRCTAGLRGGTLIINLPGGRENALAGLSAVMPALKAGVETLRGVRRD